jgi:membrane-associated protease RseP (regulator of RpoE activity)
MGLPILPITEPYSGFGSYGTVIYTLFEPAPAFEWMGDGLYWLHDIIFWFAWISLVAATFNAIPMVPLDGGYIFRDGILMIVRRIVKDNKRAEEITAMAVSAVSMVVLFTLVMVILGPYLF